MDPRAPVPRPLPVVLASAPSAVYACVLAAQVTRAPRNWDDEAVADWATPVVTAGVRPSHYASAEYYAAPEDNQRLRGALLQILPVAGRSG